VLRGCYEETAFVEVRLIRTASTCRIVTIITSTYGLLTLRATCMSRLCYERDVRPSVRASLYNVDDYCDHVVRQKLEMCTRQVGVFAIRMSKSTRIAQPSCDPEFYRIMLACRGISASAELVVCTIFSCICQRKRLRGNVDTWFFLLYGDCDAAAAAACVRAATRLLTAFRLRSFYVRSKRRPLGLLVMHL